MKAWSWFAVTPVVLAVAYSATPPLVASLTGHNAAAVAITRVELPVETGVPAAKVAQAGQEINLSSFGVLAPNGEKFIVGGKPVEAALALQSVLLTDGGGVAVVDGNMVRRGDMLGGGYRVVKIEPRAVWLAIKRTKNVKVGKRIRKVSKEELKVLHFPEYLDADLEAAKLATMRTSYPVPGSGTPAPAAPGQKTERIELEKNYKQILEMLKL